MDRLVRWANGEQAVLNSSAMLRFSAVHFLGGQVQGHAGPMCDKDAPVGEQHVEERPVHRKGARRLIKVEEGLTHHAGDHGGVARLSSVVGHPRGLKSGEEEVEQTLGVCVAQGLQTGIGARAKPVPHAAVEAPDGPVVGEQPASTAKRVGVQRVDLTHGGLAEVRHHGVAPKCFGDASVACTVERGAGGLHHVGVIIVEPADPPSVWVSGGLVDQGIACTHKTVVSGAGDGAAKSEEAAHEHDPSRNPDDDRSYTAPPGMSRRRGGFRGA